MVLLKLLALLQLIHVYHFPVVQLDIVVSLEGFTAEREIMDRKVSIAYKMASSLDADDIHFTPVCIHILMSISYT